MLYGLSFETFTVLHVLISLAGIAAGMIVAVGLIADRRLDGLTALFLAMTALTSVTGFLFPIAAVTPGLIVGALSIVLLLAALVARYGFKLSGSARWIYVVTALAALYLNCFVGVVQAFQKQPLLQPLAPTQTEPPFLIAQAGLVVIFLVVGAMALRRFHPTS